MSIDTINNFAVKNNIHLSDNELEFIYSYIKNNYLKVIDNPDELDISLYKNKFSEENYIKINNLITEYKKKIINWY